MSLTRIYQPTAFSVGETYHLNETATHYLGRVLRAKVNDELILFNGEGGEYQARITHIDKRKVTVIIHHFIEREAEPPIHIHLGQGIARGEKMDFIVQKATELGVHEITPLITERCNVRLSNEREEKRKNHWQAVAISACEQSGRNRIPIIHAPLTLSEWLAKIKVDLAFVLTPHQKENLPKKNKVHSLALLIGPEGGLSNQEIKLAEDKQFLALQLGPRILRTETAPLAALSVLQYCYGDFL